MQLIDKTISKFLVVGAVNTLAGAGTMFFLYNILGADYWISSVSNYIVGSVLSFVLNKYFTFVDKEKVVPKQIILFTINISVCYLLSYGIARAIVPLALGVYPLKVRDNASMAAGMVLFTILNYIGQKYIVFNRKKQK